MPSCLRTAKEAAANDNTHKEWREPPGYLGEAVRRAKRIPSLRPPCRAPEGLPPSP